MWKPYHYSIVETVEPFKLHSAAISYIHKLFVHLQMLLIGMWEISHTVTTTDISPDLKELADILVDISVETFSLRYYG